jgi:hypothetical protein
MPDNKAALLALLSGGMAPMGPSLGQAGSQAMGPMAPPRLPPGSGPGTDDSQTLPMSALSAMQAQNQRKMHNPNANGDINLLPGGGAQFPGQFAPPAPSMPPAAPPQNPREGLLQRIMAQMQMIKGGQQGIQ